MTRTTKTPESPEEMRSRLELMADGDPKWDLSDNDQAAIRWALNAIANVPASLPQAPAPAAPARAIAGALFDFAGYLTTLPEILAVGGAALSSPVAEHLGIWAERRGLSLDGADVENWRSLEPAPAPNLLEAARDPEDVNCGFCCEQQDVGEDGVCRCACHGMEAAPESPLASCVAALKRIRLRVAVWDEADGNALAAGIVALRALVSTPPPEAAPARPMKLRAEMREWPEDPGETKLLIWRDDVKIPNSAALLTPEVAAEAAFRINAFESPARKEADHG